MEYQICEVKEGIGLKSVDEKRKLSFEDNYEVSIKNRETDDLIEMPDELGEMELKNFLYKR